LQNHLLSRAKSTARLARDFGERWSVRRGIVAAAWPSRSAENSIALI
jgi:hypothetical protein